MTTLIIIQECAIWAVAIPAIMSLASMVGNMVQKNKASKQMRKDNEALLEKQNSLADWYESESNRDITETEQGKSLLSIAQSNYKDAIQRAESKAAITGGTTESAIAEKGNAIESYNELLNRMLGAGTEYRLGMKKEYQNALQTMGANQFNMNAMQLASSGNALANSSAALGSIAANTDWASIFGNMDVGSQPPETELNGGEPGGYW